MGMDQDDIVLAPWTAIKYRVSGSSATVVNQSAGSDTTSTINSLKQLYPNAKVNLYPIPSATQAADTPQPVRFANIHEIMAAAQSTDDIPLLFEQITELLRERHRLRAG